MRFHGRILAYHTIDRYDRALPAGIDTSPEEFARQMEYVKRRWRVVPLAEIVEAVCAGRTVARDAVAITFDDGYRDNYTNAFPVLKTLGLPATVFVVAEHLGAVWPADDWDGIEKDMLSAAEMREMASHNITFGSHGWSHCDLRELDDDTLRSELVRSREEIAEACGSAVHWLSYPFGAFDERVKQATKDAGYEAAFTVWVPQEDGFAINRLPLHKRDSGWRYRAKLNWYPMLKPLLARGGV